MRRGIFPGTFDPLTLGHLDMISRASALFDELVVGILINNKKTPLFSVEERAEMVREAVKHIDNIRVTSFDGLVVNFAREQDAGFIVRGLRSSADFEYERSMTHYNRELSSEVDTIFLATATEYSFLSSSAVRELAEFGSDIDRYVPANVAVRLKEKYRLH
ncbi:MAG: pantetheine-phosphate adenylyltransferase [Parasporobacterium sp.]|nr:pantetheine-phosphate adenylyltransferase [Parasporobacterium sp.]